MKLFKRIREALRRRGRGPKPKRPAAGGISIVITMGVNAMGRLVITVAHPVVRVDGSTLDPLTELRGWRLETQVEGASTWTQVGSLNPPSVTQREVNNVPPGTYRARASWEDIYGQTSAYAEDSTDVPVPAAPAPGGVSVVHQP